MSNYKTEQEEFWSGEFGNEYVQRNRGDNIVASNTALFSKILGRTHGVKSVVEFGPNIGLNLRALRHLLPAAELSAVEINPAAVAELRAWGGLSDIRHQSILEFAPDRQWDMALIKGVLIHIAPDHLTEVYDRLYAASGRYICVVEYYNPTPVEVPYRGHANRLFKRDFAGEILDRFADLRLVDYGFTYHRDPVFPRDDSTWFLLEKNASR